MLQVWNKALLTQDKYFQNCLYLERIAIFWLNLDSDDLHDLSLLWTLAFVAISKFFKERNQKPFSEKNKENKNSFSFLPIFRQKGIFKQIELLTDFRAKK